VKDHQTETIEQLRIVIREMQSKLDSRTQMLAYILPHLENHESRETDYAAFEFCEKFTKHIERFKEEYGKENQIQQREMGKL
jgi:hypothetical protein